MMSKNAFSICVMLLCGLCAACILLGTGREHTAAADEAKKSGGMEITIGEENVSVAEKKENASFAYEKKGDGITSGREARDSLWKQIEVRAERKVSDTVPRGVRIR